MASDRLAGERDGSTSAEKYFKLMEMESLDTCASSGIRMSWSVPLGGGCVLLLLLREGLFLLLLVAFMALYSSVTFSSVPHITQYAEASALSKPQIAHIHSESSTRSSVSCRGLWFSRGDTSSCSPEGSSFRRL